MMTKSPVAISKKLIAAVNAYSMYDKNGFAEGNCLDKIVASDDEEEGTIAFIENIVNLFLKGN